MFDNLDLMDEVKMEENNTKRMDIENALEVHFISKDGIKKPLFELDDFFQMFIFDHNDEIEIAKTEFCYNQVDKVIKTNSTERSIQEFEELLKSYGTDVKKTKNFNKKAGEGILEPVNSNLNQNSLNDTSFSKANTLSIISIESLENDLNDSEMDQIFSGTEVKRTISLSKEKAEDITEKESTERSIQEFEDILRSYGTEVMRPIISDKKEDGTQILNDTEMEPNFPIETSSMKFTQLQNVPLPCDSLIKDAEQQNLIYNGNKGMEQNSSMETSLKELTPLVNIPCDNFIKDMELDIDENKDMVTNASTSIVDIIQLDSDSDCDGYHSSDFEFITESEAKQGGIITKKTLNKQKPAKNKQSSKTAQKSTKTSINMPGPSNTQTLNSTNNTLAKYWSRSYNRGLLVKNIEKDIKTNRETHEIPQGDDYYNLFLGLQAPVNVFLENKTTRSRHLPSTCMAIEDVNFNTHDELNEEEVDIQFKKEAQETFAMILDKYPRENRKRRRY